MEDKCHVLDPLSSPSTLLQEEKFQSSLVIHGPPSSKPERRDMGIARLSFSEDLAFRCIKACATATVGFSKEVAVPVDAVDCSDLFMGL